LRSFLRLVLVGNLVYGCRRSCCRSFREFVAAVGTHY
jgi:hypothetical protein